MADNIGYSPCPGGKGKKIKFCCADLQQDLAKIERMCEGSQATACLEFVERLDQKHPDRACLTTIKASLERQLGLTAQAEQTLRPLIELDPGNYVALAEAVTLRMSLEDPGDPRELVDHVQRCIAAAPSPLPEPVAELLLPMAMLLMGEGLVLSARAHLNAAMERFPKDRQVASLIAQLNHARLVPLAKSGLLRESCPVDVPWHAPFTTLVQQYIEGRFQSASDGFSKLAKNHPTEVAILANLAAARTALTKSDAAACWRRCAEHTPDLDESVEFEAMALFVDVDNSDTVALVESELPLLDLEEAMRRLVSSPRTIPSPVPPSAEEGTPPPRFVFSILDKPLLDPDTMVTVENVPLVIGRIYLYGRETDRDARAELEAWDDGTLETAETFVHVCCGESIGLRSKKEILQSIDKASRCFNFSLGIVPGPKFTSDVQEELHASLFARLLREEFPAIRLKQFDNRSIAEAAADPTQQRAVLAHLLLLELQRSSLRVTREVQDLRRQLGLPLARTVPARLEIFNDPLALSRLHRVTFDEADLPTLVTLYRLSTMFELRTVSFRIAVQLTGRRDLPKEVDAAMISLHAAELADTTREALEWVHRRRDAAVASGKSSAPSDIVEMRLRFDRREFDDGVILLKHLAEEHTHEPGVAGVLQQTMSQLGLVPSGGRRAGAAGAKAVDTEEPGKLWTPESAPPVAAESKKSQLWLPD